jgi:hypothetical protein
MANDPSRSEDALAKGAAPQKYGAAPRLVEGARPQSVKPGGKRIPVVTQPSQPPKSGSGISK